MDLFSSILPSADVAQLWEKRAVQRKHLTPSPSLSLQERGPCGPCCTVQLWFSGLTNRQLTTASLDQPLGQRLHLLRERMVGELNAEETAAADANHVLRER